MSNWIQVGTHAFNLDVVTDIVLGKESVLLRSAAQIVGMLEGADAESFRTWWQTQIATRYVCKIAQKEVESA